MRHLTCAQDRRLSRYRCMRSCFQCPICVAPLSISAYSPSGENRTRLNYSDGPFILSCPYCSWTSLEANLQFDKSVGISSQLANMRLRDVEQDTQTPPVRRSSDESENDLSRAAELPPKDQFAALATFYRTQISETTPEEPLYGANISRRLTRLLSARGIPALRKQRGKLPIMSEALEHNEGLRVDASEEDEDLMVDRMKTLGWSGVTSPLQRERQTTTPPARSLPDLQPTAAIVRSRRTKRCRTCRNLLLRPDDRRHSAKFKVRLVAVDYLPRITLKSLDPTPNSSQLTPMKSTYFILTLRNPLFDPVEISLATPRTTPGRVESRITLLCPQFDVGANAETWDDALQLAGKGGKAGAAQQGQQAEAGKVWEKGRNWTSVVMEVVPGALRSAASARPGSSEMPITEDDVALQVPIFVRMQYVTDEIIDDADDDGDKKYVKGLKGRERKLRRELAFWCVVDVGRVEEEVY